MSSLERDLAAAAKELRETHISWVFLHENDVYKVKKPVEFGFLDFSTSERRREACLKEVELNGRLAPGVYLDVVPVTEVAGRYALAGHGPVVDWAVHMRRLPDAARADVLLAERRFASTEADCVAAAVVNFHALARMDAATTAHGQPQAIARAVLDNLEQARAVVGDYLDRRQIDEIERWQVGFVEQHEDRFRARARAGRVREGHGDLKLEHVYIEGQRISIIDCIEFNEAFRCLDVCSDLAFLSMDLCGHGRVDLAERLVSTYARRGNDYGLYGLLDFYESFRAYVRGKVAALLARDRGAPLALRERAEQTARRYFLLALACERRPLLEPMVVAVGGLMGSGKSTLAASLGLELCGPVVGSDPVRKHLLGVDALSPVRADAFAGAYGAEMSERVYDALLDAARWVVDSRRPVVLDASFRSRKERQRARDLARDLGVPFRFVECQVPRELCRARLKRRAERPHVSDGRPEIFDAFAERWEPVDELGSSEHLVVDTSGPVADACRALRAALPIWPERE